MRRQTWIRPIVSSVSRGVDLDDAEFERQQQRIRDLAERWIKPLGLNWWDIELAYARDDYEPPPQAKDADRGLAHCSVNWQYGQACITFNMPLVREQTDEKLERSVVHELMHIFLNETREAGEDWLDHEERVATMLTKAFLWLRDSLAEQHSQPTLTGGTS